MIRLTSVKGWLNYLCVLLLALSFPLQVYTGSPYPALLPYGVLALVFAVHASMPRRAPAPGATVTATSLIVLAYATLVIAVTVIQAVFGAIARAAAMSALVIYLLPVAYYGYFRRSASAREIRSILRAIVVAGAITGGYFVYDSYQKLALHRVPDYAYRAFEYTLDRANTDEEGANNARINVGSRSQGLLESQAVSGGWVVLGAFASLALLPQRRRLLRRLVVFVFGAMVVIGLNFTTILAFATIVLLFEFGGLAGLRGRVRLIVRNILPVAAIAGVIAYVTLWFAAGPMLDFMTEALSFQLNYLLGTGKVNITAVGLVLGSVDTYLRHVAVYPFTLLFGDGFSTFGMAKGGDVGFIETLATFGLPLYLTVMSGLASLLVCGARRLRHRQPPAETVHEPVDSQGAIQFAMCVILLVLFAEGHYRVWPAKSILPLLFLSVALLERYVWLAPRPQ